VPIPSASAATTACGITFSLPPASDSGATPTLEVLLVSEALPESLRNEDARYLAQRTQQGAGNLSEAGRLGHQRSSAMATGSMSVNSALSPPMPQMKA
jgi:hypothetical protein